MDFPTFSFIFLMASKSGEGEWGRLKPPQPTPYMSLYRSGGVAKDCHSIS